MEENKTKQDNSAHNKRKLKVGVFCVAALVIFYLGTSFLKGVDAFGKKRYYYAVFENTGGLQASNAVMLNGYKVGQVTDVSILSDNPVRLCAELMITEPIKIPSDSKVLVAPKDLLGGTVVNLIFGTSTKYAKNNDTLATAVVPQITDGIDDIKSQISSILVSVDTITTVLKDVLASEEGHQDLKQTLANIQTATKNLTYILEANKDKVGHLVTNLDKFSTTLQEASPHLNAIIDNLDNISDSIAKANVTQLINDAQKAVSDVQLVVDKVQRGEGSVGQLVVNDSLYQHLDSVVYNVNSLVVDFKANPKKYINVTVFGGRDKKKKQ